MSSKLKAALGDSSPHTLAINAVLIISYLVLNITMNMLNKFLLGKYGERTISLTLALHALAPCDTSLSECRHVRSSRTACTASQQHLSVLTLSSAVTGFAFPLFLTTAHSFFSFTVLLPFMMASPLRELHHGVLKKQWSGLLCIGV